MPTLDDLNFMPDILFLNSGKDWIKYCQNKEINLTIPIVSPVNNFRATRPGHPSFDFLSRKAVRLCPSPEIHRAVLEHPNTVGETLYVPNGVAVTDHAKTASQQKNKDIPEGGSKAVLLLKPDSSRNRAVKGYFPRSFTRSYDHPVFLEAVNINDLLNTVSQSAT